LAKGHVAYVATNGTDVAGWMWVSNTPLYRERWIGLRLHFDPDEVYLYDFWVYPAFRQSGAGALVTAATLRDLQRDGGVQWAYGCINRDNKPNQLLQRVVFGFQSVQSVTHVQILVAFARVLLGSATPREGPCAKTRLRSS
jgi:ribosomal protein S18 acetylase RimI-like enzyme